LPVNLRRKRMGTTMVDTNSDDPLEKLRKLSGQEQKVLILRCKGLDYKTIALLLHISVDTVKGYMQRIYLKLGIDIIPPAQRMKTIYQIYCPLLESPELPPARPEDEVVEGTFEPIPPEVEKMVDEDEYPIVHVQPQPLKTIPKTDKKSRRIVWLILGLTLGLCLGATGSILVGRLNFEAMPFLPQPTATTTLTSTPSLTVSAIPSATPETPTQTPIIVQQVIVVTATEPPSNATPSLPTATDTPLATLPFVDTFDLRARPEWEISTGTWRVLDGHFTAENNNAWQIAFVGDLNWHNYKIETTTFSKQFVDPIRIILRANKDGYIAFEYYAAGARWLLVNGENEKELASVDHYFDSDTIYKVIVEVKDDIYTAYINGIQYSQIQDTTYPQGRVGIGFNASYLNWFDDFRVTELP